MPLPTNRTTASSKEDHLTDHNTAHGILNDLPGTYVAAFTPEFYGALGGSADDSVAIYAAISAAKAAGGGVVTLSKVYLVNTPQGSAPLDSQGKRRAIIYLTGADNVTIASAGKAKAGLRTTLAYASTILEVRDSTGTCVRGLTLTQNGLTNFATDNDANISGSCVRFTNVTRGTVAGTDCSNAAYSAIYFTGGTSHSDATGNFVHDGVNPGIGNGINEDSVAGTAGTGHVAPRGCIIAGNHIKDVVGSGSIVIDNEGLASFTQVRGNIIDGNTGYQGIRLLNCQNVIVAGNTVRASKNEGIYCFSSVAMSAVQITGNQIEGCGVTSGTAGIVVTSTGGSLPRDVLVEGNVVRASGSVGIYVSDVTDVLVCANIVKGSGTKGIQAFYDAARQGITITGNIVADSTNEGIQLQATAAVSFCDISGNQVRHGDAAGIRFSPSSPAFISDVRVSGNVLESNDEANPGTTDGIVIDGTKILIDGNVVDGQGTHHRYGLLIASTATLVEVGQNILTGSLTANFLDSSGTANIAVTDREALAGVLTAGESNMPWDAANNGAIPTGNQSLRIRYFTARKTQSISQVRVTAGSTPAGATPSLIRIGIWTADAAGALISLVGSTPNDTTLLAAANTDYTKGLSAAFMAQKGQRYASAILVVTAATAPTVWGLSVANAQAGHSPKRGGLVGGQANLPSSVVAGSVSDGGNMPYIELLP